MPCTRAGLCSYLPLSLEGPKGEGDKGGEGSPVGLGRCLPKCDINPLTLPEHPCYYPHRSNTNLTISRRNQKLGNPTRPIRGLNVQAHPNGRPAACGTSDRRHLLIPPGLVSPSLTTQAMEGPSTLRGTPPSRGPCRIGAPYQGSAYASASTLPAKLNGPALPGLGPSSPYAAPPSSPSANSIPPMTTSSRMLSRTAVER